MESLGLAGQIIHAFIETDIVSLICPATVECCSVVGHPFKHISVYQMCYLSSFTNPKQRGIGRFQKQNNLLKAPLRFELSFKY